MSITQVANMLQGALLRGGHSLSVESDTAFNHSLTVGQILKAKVMRHYEGSRYLADFGGQEKVVDSTIPLRVGEQIQGRVTALGDRVHMQRINFDGATVDNRNPKPAKSVASHVGAHEQLLNEVFARYQGVLNQQDRANLLKLLARSAHPEVMVLSGLLLSKLGVRISPEFSRAVYQVLGAEQGSHTQQEVAGQFQLNVDRQASHQDSTDAIQQLAGLLNNKHIEDWRHQPAMSQGDADYLDDVADGSGVDVDSNSAGNDYSGDSEHAEWLLGRWLLNMQSEGSVNHRLMSLPLWFGDRLVEVNVALFSQREDNLQPDGTRYRRIVLSLDTERLGHVELTVNMSDHA